MSGRPSASSTLDAMPEAAAREALERCCGAKRWVAGMLERRPFASDTQLLTCADEVWAQMGPADYHEAFAHHPRIGASLEALRDGNLRYEARFGHIFIVCASGKTAAQMLALLEDRLGNEPEAELAVAAAQQHEITRLRLLNLHSEGREVQETRKQAPVMSTRSPITTHVLDTSVGHPAAGVPVQLSRETGDGWELLAERTTDTDGRVGDLLTPGSLQAGTYRIRFATASYFASIGVEDFFYPYAEIVFRVHETAQHYHVPLLLNPFGYSTYRGS